ncbi:MAG: redoxin domain-containing protein [Chlorobi bacterium]|nr:redoxin domain-containing protein [Chlorobiota bacterium]
MKNIFLITIAITLLPVFGCEAGNHEKNNSNDTSVIKKSSKNDEDSGKVIHLTKADFLEKVMNYEKNTDKWVFEGDKPCVIDFYADWCPPCKIASPILEELAKEYAGKVNVYKVNTQKERELAGIFGITSIPAFLWCSTEGKPQMSSGIARTPEDTKAMFKQMFDNLK